MKVHSGETEKRCFPGPVQRAAGYLSFPVLGLVPIRDGPLTAGSLFKCGHHVAPSVPRKGKTQRKPQRREGGPEAPQKSHQDSKPVSPFVRSPFVWGCHTESPANSLAGSQPTFSWRSFREEASLGTWSTAWTRPSPGGASEKRPPWGRPMASSGVGARYTWNVPLQCGRPLGEFSSIFARRCTTSATMQITTVPRPRTLCNSQQYHELCDYAILQ